MYRFRKRERLTGKKTIEELFSKGNAFFSYPFRVFWRITETESVSLSRMAVSVPSRKIKKAVKRNLIKRRTREAYRLKRHVLLSVLTEFEKGAAILFLYTPSDILEYSKIEKGVEKAFEKIEAELRTKLSGRGK